jgi:hypothetical protein
MLALTLEQQGRKQEAAELYRDVTQEQPERAAPH